MELETGEALETGEELEWGGIRRSQLEARDTDLAHRGLLGTIGQGWGHKSRKPSSQSLLR